MNNNDIALLMELTEKLNSAQSRVEELGAVYVEQQGKLVSAMQKIADDMAMFNKEHNEIIESLADMRSELKRVTADASKGMVMEEVRDLTERFQSLASLFTNNEFLVKGIGMKVDAVSDDTNDDIVSESSYKNSKVDVVEPSVSDDPEDYFENEFDGSFEDKKSDNGFTFRSGHYGKNSANDERIKDAHIERTEEKASEKREFLDMDDEPEQEELRISEEERRKSFRNEIEEFLNSQKTSADEAPKNSRYRKCYEPKSGDISDFEDDDDSEYKDESDTVSSKNEDRHQSDDHRADEFSRMDGKKGDTDDGNDRSAVKDQVREELAHNIENISSMVDDVIAKSYTHAKG